MAQRLFYDASYTLRNPIASGVHRVVSRCWEAIKAQTEDIGSGVSLTRIVHVGNQFVAAKSVGSEPTEPRWDESIGANTYRRIFSAEKSISFRPGDVLLLPDAYWACSKVWKAVARARSEGASVTTLVYDLIPLQHPAIYGSAGASLIRHYLEQVIRYSDQIVTISRTVASDVATFVGESALPGNGPQILSWRLGCDLPRPTGVVRNGVQNLFNSRMPDSPYLVVGSFDQRKNHRFVLQCFDALWSRAETSRLRLAFAGTPSVDVEPIVTAVRQHPMYDRKLFLLPGLSDAELDHAYQNARGVIAASLAEGFCLPIVEALYYGQNVIVSDTPIHREVGSNSCDFFSLDSCASLEEAVVKIERSHGDKSASLRAPMQLHTWEESAANLLDLVVPGARQSLEIPRASSACRSRRSTRTKVLYFTIVPIAVDSNGGSLCCREHIRQLAADETIDLEVVAAGEHRLEHGTQEFLSSVGVRGTFCGLHDASMSVFLPWATRIWPYAHEQAAIKNKHIADHVSRRMLAGQPDVILVDYTPSAAFVPNVYAGQAPVVTIRLSREAEFHRELVRHGIHVGGKPATYIGSIRVSRFESWVHRRSAAVVAIGRHDLPSQAGKGPRTFWFPPLPNAIAPTWKYAGHKEIGFVGNIGHFPNRDAVEWLATKFAPAIAPLDAEAKVVIIGADESQIPRGWVGPNIDFRGIADRSAVDSLLRSAAYLIAPLPMNDGAKLKVFEGMQCGTPLLATEAALSGVACLPWLHRIDLEDPGHAARMAVEGMNSPDLLSTISERITTSSRAYAEKQAGRWGELVREVAASARRPADKTIASHRHSNRTDVSAAVACF